MRAEWDLVGGNPAPGSPSAFAAMAGDFRGTAEKAAAARRQLLALRDGVDGAVWRGKAADAFGEDIGPLAERLAKLHASYERAADALSSYGGILERLQEEATRLLADAVAANNELGQLEEVALVDAAPLSVLLPSPDGTAELARWKLGQARAGIDRLRDERRGAEAKVVAGLDEAGDLGIRSRRRWERAFGGITSVVDSAWDATGGRVVSGVDDLTGEAISGVNDFLGDVVHGASVALNYVADNWRGIGATVVVVGGGAFLVATGVAPLAVGIGGFVGAGTSVFSQVMTNGEVDWGKAALSGGVGLLASWAGLGVTRTLKNALPARGLVQPLLPYMGGGAASGFTGSAFSEAWRVRFEGGRFGVGGVLAKTVAGVSLGAVGGAAPTEFQRRLVGVVGSTWVSLLKSRSDAGLPVPRAPWDPRPLGVNR